MEPAGPGPARIPAQARPLPAVPRRARRRRGRDDRCSPALGTFGNHLPVFVVLAEILAVAANIGLYFVSFRVLTPKGVPSRVSARRARWSAASPGPCCRCSAATWCTTTCTVTRSTACSPPCSAWSPGCTSPCEMTVYAAEVNVVLARHLWPRAHRPAAADRGGPVLDGASGPAEPAPSRAARDRDLRRPARRASGRPARRRRRPPRSHRPPNRRSGYRASAPLGELVRSGQRCLGAGGRASGVQSGAAVGSGARKCSIGRRRSQTGRRGLPRSWRQTRGRTGLWRAP